MPGAKRRQSPTQASAQLAPASTRLYDPSHRARELRSSSTNSRRGGMSVDNASKSGSSIAWEVNRANYAANSAPPQTRPTRIRTERQLAQWKPFATFSPTSKRTAPTADRPSLAFDTCTPPLPSGKGTPLFCRRHPAENGVIAPLPRRPATLRSGLPEKTPNTGTRSATTATRTAAKTGANSINTAPD